MRRTTKLPLMVTLALMATTALSATSCSRGNAYAAGPAENYFHDLGFRDYAAACALFTDGLRRQLGDCPATLRKRLDGLPVGEVNELQNVSVSHVIYQDKDRALVYPRYVTTRRTVTVKVNRSPAPRSSAVRSIAANHATDGKALQLTKTGDGWQISGWA